MSAIDRLLIWAKDEGMVFATQAGGHPDDYLDEILPELSSHLKYLRFNHTKCQIMESHIHRAHSLIPTNSEADLIINKMFVKLSDIDKDFKNDK